MQETQGLSWAEQELGYFIDTVTYAGTSNTKNRYGVPSRCKVDRQWWLKAASAGGKFEVLDALPPVGAIMILNDLIAVGEEFYKLAVTDSTEPNLFEGDVGRDVFNTTAGERWRGISNSQSPNGFSTDGEFTANPNNTLSLLLASSARHLRVAMKRSVYEAAKGKRVQPERPHRHQGNDGRWDDDRRSRDGVLQPIYPPRYERH